MTGMIFDIQRFSLYDGPGIRTNVFLKGCPLRCLWCHNPESQNSKKELLFYKSRCTGCGKCREICSRAGTDQCVACGMCVDICPSGAREISGREASVEEIIAEVLRDKSFYDSSGGGVTITGGEPLAQPGFVFEILSECRKNGIHTAVETSGFANEKIIKRLKDEADLILYDIKGIDEELHKRNTGVSNSVILKNASFLMESGANVIFRMPYIPGYNDGEIEKISLFTKGFPFEIMAYHKTGISKYDSLGRNYSLTSVEPPNEAELDELKYRYGCKCNSGKI